MQNIKKDKDELVDLVKQLCIFIRPEAFKDEISTNRRVSKSTEIVKELQSKTMLTPEELDIILHADAGDLETFTFIDKA
jgi:hypothetical protein